MILFRNTDTQTHRHTDTQRIVLENFFGYPILKRQGRGPKNSKDSEPKESERRCANELYLQSLSDKVEPTQRAQL